MESEVKPIGLMFEYPSIGQLVLVHWEDTTNIAEWLDPEELIAFARDGAWKCENVGWLLYDDDECIVVVARRSHDHHRGLSERIPKRSVTKIQVLAGGW